MSFRNHTLVSLGAVALAFAFPGFNLWPLAWVALVPLILSLHKSSPRRAVGFGLLFGIVFYAVLIHWIRLFGYLPWALLVIIEAITAAAFALLTSLILRLRNPLARVIGPAAAWVLVEWLRSLGPAGFTWGSLAYSQAYNLPVARLASLTGPWGVTFLIVLVNAGIAEAVLLKTGGRKIAAVLVPLTAVAAVYAWGVGDVYRGPHRPLKVAALQACLPQLVNVPRDYAVRQWEAYRELNGKAVKLKPDFIVWPESSMPEDIDGSPAMRGYIEESARTSGADIIAGGVHELLLNGQPKEQNGAYVIRPKDGLADRYYKVRLVPFGEYVPARKWLTIAKRYGVREVDYVPGPGWHPMDTSRGRVGTVICFESTFPQISRTLVRKGAGLLFVLTNDGWFERTSATEQHMQSSVFRAIENHRYVIRSASTGISAVISPDGRITSRLPLWKRGVMTGEVEILKGETLYTRFGDWFAFLCAGVAAVLVGIGILEPRMNTD